MDIHKPKAAHSLREFLIEIGTIICGILIALSLEQGVEWLHWQHEVELTHETLKPEFLRIVRNVGRKDADSPCLIARMNDMQSVLQEAENTGRLPAMGPLPELGNDPWTPRAWDGIVSSQVLAHLPRHEALNASGVVSTAQYLGRLRDEAIAQWSQLATLNGPSRRVTSSELTAYKAALAKTGIQLNTQRAIADAQVARILETGLATRAEVEDAWRVGVDQGRREPICQPISREPSYFSASLQFINRPTKLPF